MAMPMGTAQHSGTSITLRNVPVKSIRPAPKPDEPEDFVRPAVKISDLPLTAAQRTTIDDLVKQFTRKGDFDTLRKAIIARFDQSDAKNDFITALGDLTERELDKQPALLAKERRISAPLIAGAAERSEVFRNVESILNGYVREALENVDTTLRTFRRAQIGDAAATEEQDRGKKTDAEFVKEAEERHQKRLKAFYLEREKNLLKEIEEAKRKKEEELKAKEARDKAYREMKEKRDREVEEQRARIREQDRLKREEQEERDREMRRRASRKITPPPEVPALPQTEKELEEVALLELLKEGERAAKERQLPNLDRERSRNTPPHRAMLSKTLGPPGRRESLPTEARAVSASTGSDRFQEPRKMSRAEDLRTSRPDERVERHESEKRSSHYRDEHSSRHMDERRESKYDQDRRSSRYDEPYERSSYSHRDDRRRESGRYRSRSRSVIRSSRDHDDRSYRKRSPSPLRRRSRSRERRRDEDSHQRDHHRDDGRSQRKPRSRSPPGIDRYVPGGSRRERSKDRDDRRDRDRSRDRDYDRDRKLERKDDRYDERRESHRERSSRHDPPRRHDRERETTAGAERDRRDSDRRRSTEVERDYRRD